MNLLLITNKIFNKISRTNLKLSFSQCGEDSIILFLIQSLKLNNIRYFDIGTNHPKNLNNTYLLYLYGYRGICIEPDPIFHRLIKRSRPNDILIAAGVAIERAATADFYLMDDPLLNTFSAAEAQFMVENHQRSVRKKINIPLQTINEIFGKTL